MNEEQDKELQELIYNFKLKAQVAAVSSHGGKSISQLTDAEHDLVEFVHAVVQASQEQNTPQERPNTIKEGDYFALGGSVYMCEAVCKVNGKLSYLLNGRVYSVEQMEHFTPIEILEQEEQEQKDKVLPDGFWQACDLIFGEFQYKAIVAGDAVLIRPNNSPVKK